VPARCLMSAAIVEGRGLRLVGGEGEEKKKKGERSQRRVLAVFKNKREACRAKGGEKEEIRGIPQEEKKGSTRSLRQRSPGVA